MSHATQDSPVLNYNLITKMMRDKYAAPTVEPEEVGDGLSGSGFRVLVLGHARHGGNTIALNVIGQRMPVEAVIASFHSNRITRPVTIAYSNWNKDQLSIDGNDRWRVYRQGMERLNIVNAMIISQRVVDPRPDAQSVYVMADNAGDLITGCWLRIRNGINPRIAVQRHWATYLFRKGRDAGRIVPCSSKGMNLYYVDLKDKFWSELISEALKNNEITWNESQTTTLERN